MMLTTNHCKIQKTKLSENLNFVTNNLRLYLNLAAKQLEFTSEEMAPILYKQQE
jgi:hypothetical protein